MGLHFGVLAGELSAAALVAEIGARAPRMVEQGPLASLAGFKSANDDGWDLAVGDLDGRGYILDESWAISGSEPDLVADIAASTGALLVGCGGETVSGTFYCVVAQGSKILRHYYHCETELAEPYSVGPPFPSERSAPLDDLQGAGFWEVMKSLGFDLPRWEIEAEKRRVTWTADYLETNQAFPCKGPLAAAIDHHRQKYLLKPEDRPPLTIRLTDSMGQVIDVATGARASAPAKPRKPWWRFW